MAERDCPKCRGRWYDFDELAQVVTKIGGSGPISIALSLSLLSIASPARANLSQARDNVETIASNYVARHSPSGYWPLKDSKTGKTLRLTLSRIDTATTRALGRERYAVLGSFMDSAGNERLVELTADFSRDWEVKSARLVRPEEGARLRREAVKAAGMADKPQVLGPLGRLPDISLPTLDGGSRNVSDCAAAKCLTVVLAPWCPYCRDLTKDIVEMRSWLKPRGVDVHVIVGFAEYSELTAYAENFGPETMIDADKSVRIRNGVPSFTISKDGGMALSRPSGARGGHGGPALAAYLGLP